MRRPNILPILEFVRVGLRSATDAMADGKKDVAERRVHDAVAVSHGLLDVPSMIDCMVQVVVVSLVTDWTAEHLQQLDDAAIPRLDDLLASFD